MNYPSGWTENNNILEKVFTFKNFLEAVSFVRKVANISEEKQHHPDIEIYSYKKVRIKLTTHDEGNKITEKDIFIAERIEKLYSTSDF